jgi:hypothetical protein
MTQMILTMMVEVKLVCLKNRQESQSVKQKSNPCSNIIELKKKNKKITKTTELSTLHFRTETSTLTKITTTKPLNHNLKIKIKKEARKRRKRAVNPDKKLSKRSQVRKTHLDTADKKTPTMFSLKTQLDRETNMTITVTKTKI